MVRAEVYGFFVDSRIYLDLCLDEVAPVAIDNIETVLGNFMKGSFTWHRLSFEQLKNGLMTCSVIKSC